MAILNNQMVFYFFVWYGDCASAQCFTEIWLFLYFCVSLSFCPFLVYRSHMFPGWWYTYPSGKYEFVSWDDIPNIWKVIKVIFQSTKQFPIFFPYVSPIFRSPVPSDAPEVPGTRRGLDRGDVRVDQHGHHPRLVAKPMSFWFNSAMECQLNITIYIY